MDNSTTMDDGGWMQTANGNIFHPLDPRAEEVHIEDIALSLSRQNRYNGMSDRAVSVAQHSVQCKWLVEKTGGDTNCQLALLMHDAAEAYLGIQTTDGFSFIGDMITPLKTLFPEFATIEDRIMDIINERFNLPTISYKAQKYYDRLAMAWEKRDMYKSSCEWPGIPDCPDWIPPMATWSSDFAKATFLEHFEILQKGRGTQ